MPSLEAAAARSPRRPANAAITTRAVLAGAGALLLSLALHTLGAGIDWAPVVGRDGAAFLKPGGDPPL
jgi:hypothetical protein